ncbi:hypothetical protein TNCV_2853461 [Trichonephila clavipes]|uniref:Uncharacterized protein n=1 Tax=Trichonephila clavipes TaxID=2585209 RepID=A0A8X6RC58_TRICX|nr:hypothetical protein TNCV_2853461 [Trichonephila clavipes]
MAGRNMRKFTVRETLEYIQQSLENESENNNDDEYVPLDEENVSSDEDTISNFPVQCNSRKTTLGKKKQSVNKRKKLLYSNPDEMNSGTFVTNYGTCWKSIPSGSRKLGRIAEHNVFKDKSGPNQLCRVK